jgi:ferredoxin
MFCTKAGDCFSVAAVSNSHGKEARLSMTLNVDYGLCQGCGGCAEAYPELFVMRGEKAWVINPGKFDPLKHKGVLSICPYYAITLE